MRTWLTIFCLLVLSPGGAAAEDAVSPYKWTIGYESGKIMLRRFLDADWEIFLGGEVARNDGDSPSLRTEYRQDLGQEPAESEEISSGILDEDHFGAIALGVGRTIMREGRFWLNATFTLSYEGGSRRWLDWSIYPYLEGTRTRTYDRSAHARSIGCGLGLRPAFDLTERVIVALGFGFRYGRTHVISDLHSDYEYDLDGDGFVDQGDYSHERTSSWSDAVTSFGSVGFDSLSFIYRF